eukprot:748708-Prorocentrum_minimum.AAC.1
MFRSDSLGDERRLVRRGRGCFVSVAAAPLCFFRCGHLVAFWGGADLHGCRLQAVSGRGEHVLHRREHGVFVGPRLRGVDGGEHPRPDEPEGAQDSTFDHVRRVPSRLGHAPGERHGLSTADQLKAAPPACMLLVSGWVGGIR